MIMMMVGVMLLLILIRNLILWCTIVDLIVIGVQTIGIILKFLIVHQIAIAMMILAVAIQRSIIIPMYILHNAIDGITFHK